MPFGLTMQELVNPALTRCHVGAVPGRTATVEQLALMRALVESGEPLPRRLTDGEIVQAIANVQSGRLAFSGIDLESGRSDEGNAARGIGLLPKFTVELTFTVESELSGQALVDRLLTIWEFGGVRERFEHGDLDVSEQPTVRITQIEPTPQ